MKEQITKVLKTYPLFISQTRRSGTNGLRNADELAKTITDVIDDRETKLIMALQRTKEVLDRYGSITKNSETYAYIADTLKQIGVGE